MIKKCHKKHKIHNCAFCGRGKTMEKDSKKRSTIFPHAWFKSLEKLPDDIAGRIYKAVQRLDITGEMTTFEAGTIEDILFSQFAFQTDEFGQAYAKTCENRSKAAKEREAKKAQKAQSNSFVDDRIGWDGKGKDGNGMEREDAAGASIPHTSKKPDTKNKFKNFDERVYPDEVYENLLGGGQE